MSTDIADRLRELAHEHYEGRLNLAAYRALRGPLLDSLASGAPSPAMEITQPRVSHRQMQRDAITRPGKPHVAPLPDAPPKKNRTVLAICVAGAIVVALVALIASQRSHPVAQPNTNTTATPARSAVDEFMATGDWTDGRVTALNATLMELGGGQIAPQRFVDELRRRLKEQQALSPTTLTADNSPLAALAVTVGIDLNSPDSALHISAAPPVVESPTAPHTAGPKSIPTPASAHPDVKGTPTDGDPTPVAQQQAAATESVTPGRAAATGITSGATVVPDATATGPSTRGAAVSVVPQDDTCRRELIHSRRPLCQDAEGPTLALIPAGAFDMGSTEAPEEQPVHRVTIPDPFGISIYEVSQAEFKQFCDATHRTCPTQPWVGDDYPVVNVSWDDAHGYVEWLSATTHHHYSLPTESQWEYAARAGNTGLYPSGAALSPTDAHFSMLKKETTAARRSQKFNANAFRLVHTVGNVREWVEDPWSPNYASAPSDGTAAKSTKPAMRVARGGSYTTRLRLSMREGLAPDTRDVTTGFRIVRELQ